MQSSIKRLIARSHQSVTIMFTDIVDSTRYWDTHGDIKGRLMVDQHNRLVFPVIKKFHGKVVKTIGDSVMASFSSPAHAVRAAAGIQQAVADYRKQNKRFKLEMRIGIHTGNALVEKRDVFGDVVNVAARVEGLAGAGEILISGSTEKRVKRSEFALTRKKSFTPKGKKTEIVTFACDWEKLPNQIEGVNFNAVLPVLGAQRSSMLVYLLAILAMTYYAVHNYLRYVLADQENVYLLSVNPQQLVAGNPVLAVLILVAAFALFSFLRQMTVVPVFWCRIIKGGFGYTMFFAATLLVLALLPASYSLNKEKVFFESKHLFVEVLQDQARIRQIPSLSGEIIKLVNARDLLLLADVHKEEQMVWNKVLIVKGTYGWIARAIPPSYGVAEKRLTIANKFYFKYRDLYALVVGLFGFLWGFFSFSIRPL